MPPRTSGDVLEAAPAGYPAIAAAALAQCGAVLAPAPRATPPLEDAAPPLPHPPR